MYKGKYSQPRIPVMEQDITTEQEITEESIIAEVHAREEEEKATKTAAPKQAPKQKKKKKASKGTKAFYIIYLIFVVLLVAAAVVAMYFLRNFLVNYQASRPEEKSLAVYAEFFLRASHGEGRSNDSNL